MFVHTVPPMHGEIHPGGYDGRYRLYTVEHLPFDALPAYVDGGPAKVVLYRWATSTTFPTYVEGGGCTLDVTLNVSGPDGFRHPLDGTVYATIRDAEQAVYEAGATAFMVYEREAARFGLPVEA